jgi:thioesterase domain-containing protein
MARAMAAIAGKELRLTLEEIEDLPLEEALALVLGRAREAGLADDSIDLPWLLRYRQSFNARIQSGSRYRARPYPGRISLFLTTGSDSDAPPEGEDRGEGWRVLAEGPVETCWVPGTHDEMLLEPHVLRMAEALADSIDRVMREKGD